MLLPVRFNAPAEFSAKVPDVVVESVRLADVVPIVEVPRPIAEIAPDEEVRLKLPDPWV